MNLLSVNEYDRAEADAVERTPNIVIQQVGSVMFDRIGYPMRVKTDRAVSRYVDVMHETRFEHDIDVLLGGLTDGEVDLLLAVNKTVADMTKRLYGQRLFTTGSAVRALIMLRNFQMLYGDRKLTVLEVGPGSGYLGAMLMLRGHKYVSTDVTQAMYVYQNHLWNYILPGRFHELVTEDGDIGELLSSDGPIGIHIPWWKYLSLFGLPQLFKVDVVTANHVLCEMPPGGRAYTIKLARRLLDEGVLGPAFVFEGWGAYEGWGTSATVTPYTVTSLFKEIGYALRFDDMRLTVLEPVPVVNKKRSLATRISRRGRREIRQLLGRRPTPIRPRAEPVTRVTEAISKGRLDYAGKKKHNSIEVASLLKSALQLPSLETPNEQFYKFISPNY
jgi:hypothetical protein